MKTLTKNEGVAVSAAIATVLIFLFSGSTASAQVQPVDEELRHGPKPERVEKLRALRAKKIELFEKEEGEIHDARKKFLDRAREERDDLKDKTKDVRHNFRAKTQDALRTADTPEDRKTIRDNARKERDELRDKAKDRRSDFRNSFKEKRDEFRGEAKEKRSDLRDKFKKNVKERMQAKLDRIIDRLSAGLDRLTKLHARIQSFVDKKKADGMDTSTAQTLIDTAEGKVSIVKDEVRNIRTFIDEMKLSDNPRELMKELRTMIRNTITHFKEAKTSIKEAIRSVKALK